MQEKLMSQKNSIIIMGVIIGILLLGGYAFYNLQKEILSTSENSSLNVKLLTNKDLKDFYDVKDKIKLKDADIEFTKKDFYKNLVDHTVDIPSVEPTGRPNPFWTP